MALSRPTAGISLQLSFLFLVGVLVPGSMGVREDRLHMPPAKLDDFPDEAGVSSNPFVSGVDGYHSYRIPSLLHLSNGHMLLFCEGRKLSSADHDWNDVLTRRSTDGGESWGDLQIVHSESTVDKHVTIGNPARGPLWRMLDLAS